jgi:biotin synthase-like enzyme
MKADPEAVVRSEITEELRAKVRAELMAELGMQTSEITDELRLAGVDAAKSATEAKVIFGLRPGSTATSGGNAMGSAS